MTMRREAAIAGPAARQDGLATRAQLRDAGVTDRQIDLVARGAVLQRLHRGVYHHRAAPYTARTRLRAAVLACGPSAVASHRSAAVLHGFDVRRSVPEVTVVGRGVPRTTGIRLHRTKHLPPADRTSVDGIPVTTAARTALDLGAVLPFEVVEHVLQVAIVERRVDERSLLAVLERSGASGRNGTGVLRAVVAQSLPPEKIESMLEHELLGLIRRAGLPEPVLQFELTCTDGRCVRLDTAWPEVQLAVEGDGHRWHATTASTTSDRARRRSIQASGWEHHAFGWDEVHDRPLDTIAELAALLPRFASR